MRPLIVDLGRNYRGGQHQALLLLQGLRSRGHAPELIAVRGSVLAHRAKNAGISVHRVPPGCRRIAAALHIRRRVREQHADIVHANEPHALSAAWMARAHRRVPLIASRRVVLPLSTNAISLARYRAAARVVAVSHCVANGVIQGGLPASCVDVIYDGVQIFPQFSPADRDQARGLLGIPRESFCIGNIAAFVAGKGHDVLVRAFAELRTRNPASILLLRGEGHEQAAVQELARQLQVIDAVKFQGPSTEIETMFAAMDLFAFPVRAEAMGSVLLAAMAHSLPVVASACGGIPEVVESEKNGLLLDRLDSKTLADAMTRLLENPEQARSLGRAARETIVARFSADHMVDATLRLYTDLIAARI